MKFRYITVIFIILLSTVLSVTSLADDTFIIADFDSNNAPWVSWTAGDAVNEVMTVPDAYKNSNRKNILCAYGQSTDSSVVRTVTAEFDTPLDLSLYKSVNASIFVDSISDEGNNNCFARIILYNSSGKRFEDIVSLEAGAWFDISFNISSWNGRNSITSLEFGIVPDHIESGVWSGGYALDNICAADPVNTEMTDRFSFETCISEGGSIRFPAERSYFEFSLDENTDIAFLEFDIAVPIDSHDNALRINLENHSDIDHFTVVLLRSDSKAPTRIVRKIPDTASAIHLIDLEDPASIVGIRLEFPNNGGSVVINAIEFTSTYDSAAYITYGDVSRCELSSDGKLINIVGTLPREYVTEYSNCELLLYSLELNEDPHEFDYENAEPVARHGMSTKFRFTVDAVNDTFSPKFKKYVVMVSSSPMIYVDTPTYITESDTLRTNNTALELGLFTESAYVISNAADTTIIDIYLDQILNHERSGYMYASQDGHYYFEKNFINALDRRLGALKTAGVTVSLRLMLEATAITDSVGSASGILDKADYLNLRAAVEFLSLRYSGDNGIVDSFIIGNAVNTGGYSGYSASLSMTEFVNSYADLLRFIYLCTDNVSCPSRVYASVGDVFEYEMLGRINNRFDTSLFVDALSTYIADEGDFPWGICVESSLSLNEKRTGDKILSISDTDSFDELFALLLLRKGSKEIPVIAAEHIGDTESINKGIAEFTAENIMNAARYGKFKRYVILCDEDDSLYTDDIASTLKSFASNNKIALEALGVSYKNYSELIESKRLSSKKETTANTLPSLPFEEKGKYSYFDFNSYSQLDNSSLSYNTQALKLVPMQTGTLALRANLERTDSDEPMGFGLSLGKGKNFELTPAVSFDIMLSGLPESYTDSVGLNLRFIGSSTVCTAYTQITPNSWQSVYIDLSNTDGASENIYTSIELSLTDVQADSATLYLDNFLGYSEKYSTEELEALISSDAAVQEHSGNNISTNVVTVFIIIITALVSLTIILILRSRRIDKTMHQ